MQFQFILIDESSITFDLVVNTIYHYVFLSGGIHVYYLLSSYYTSWPLLFFGVLTVVGAAYSHGGKYLMKDLGDMSKMPLTHYISAHLSVLYTSIIPLLMAVSIMINEMFKISNTQIP